MPNEPGLVHVYTGKGKSKTTAALGLAVRALGWGKRVYICQFLKPASQKRKPADYPGSPANTLCLFFL